jgi:rRNA-processing protein FCF1
MGMLVVDAANVIGSRPDGWWRDRPGAARKLVERIRAATAAGRLPEPVVVVLEGAARAGVGGTVDGVEVVHAPGSGDDMIVSTVAHSTEPVMVVTSDRGLRRRVESLGADVAGPRWLLNRLDA